MLLDLYSQFFRRWFRLSDVLIDTGADLSVIPLRLGEALVPDVELRTPLYLGGAVLQDTPFNAYIHTIEARLGSFQFPMPVAIALTQTPPVIFGRLQALDRFHVTFDHGMNVVFTARVG
ncbi:MAG: hypothetical protein KJ063_19695 [Anaerolineae bacterium]|nr:hypothetical protein [Anaerolineae bacterium]